MSGYCDSNTGPSGPKPDALANCATPRLFFIWDCKYRAFFYNHQIFPNIFFVFLENYAFIHGNGACIYAGQPLRSNSAAMFKSLICPLYALLSANPRYLRMTVNKISSSSVYEAVYGRQCNQAEFCAEPRLFGYGRRSSILQKQKSYSEKHKYLIYRQKDTLKFEPSMIG